MSKFYEIIKAECDFQYDNYILESNVNEKSELLSRFAVAYTLQEKCFGKGDFDIVIEYLKLKSDMKRELNEIIKVCGKDDSSTIDRANKLAELDKIGFLLKECDIY